MSEALKPRSGTTTIASTGVPQRLVTASIVVAGVGLKARATANGQSADVLIDGDTISATSYPLSPGEKIAMDIVDLANVWIQGSVGDIIYWIGLVP